MILSAWLLEDSFLHIIRCTFCLPSPPSNPCSLNPRIIIIIISITFTALIATELFMVAIQINRWHFLMVGVAYYDV
jgi:hypothetical protein